MRKPKRDCLQPGDRIAQKNCRERVGTVRGFTRYGDIYRVDLDRGGSIDVYRHEVVLLPGQRVAATMLAK